MDAVELPLPANVVVSKLLATDGFGRVRESESRGSDGADASIFGSRKVSGGSSYRRDVKRPLSGCSSDFRCKKADAELCMHENMLSSFKCEENGDTHYLGEADKPILLSPKHEGKPMNRKSVKKLSIFPCSKRPRTNQTENSIKIAGADDVDVISREIAPNLIGLTCPEKCRMAKKKRCQDGKRTDKKNTRASVRTKYETFSSKAGFASSDSASGGNNILGIYGLKSDLRDVTKHVDELSLTELLDGSYKYPNACPDKGKKAPNAKENILLSVRKACSVLQPHGAIEKNGNRKALCLPNPNSCSSNMSDSDDKDKCIEESVPFSTFQDPCQENFGDSILYHPKVILERLALPPAHDLDALLNLSMTSLPLQSTVNMTTFRHASLPPFPWSSSHNGSWKPSVDSGKLASTRNTCQGRWVRIGSNSTSSGDDHSCLSELELKLRTFDRNEDSRNQQKIDDLLQDVKALTAPAKPSFDGPFSMSCAMTSLSEAHIPGCTISVKGSGVFGSSSSKMLNLLEDVDSSNHHLESVSKDHPFLKHSESESGPRCQGNESNLGDPSNFNLRFKESEVAEKEQPAVSCSDSCYCCPRKSTDGECDENSQKLPAPEIFKPGLSPRLVVAAEILCEMASCSRSTRTQNHTFGRIKWPKAPSQKTMKARKSLSSMEKTDGLFLAASNYDPVKSTGLSSIKHKSLSENKNGFTHMDNAGREPVRWLAPAEGCASPGKLDRDLNVHARPLHSNSVRPSGLMPSPTQVERGFDSQQKLRKATPKTTSFVFGGTCIKDWSRGRSKRV